MCDYAELYALIYKGDVVGYRILAVINGENKYYDFRRADNCLDMYCVNRLKLIQRGSYLVTKDELEHKYTPKEIVNNSKLYNDLLNQVKYYYRLNTEKY